jgi:twinkle protein
MVQLRTLVQELDFALLMVSHLRRAQGDQGYEDGKQVTLSGLRSSSSIGQLSDCVIALERTLSGDDAEERNTVKVRVLKNRYTGDTGLVGELVYDKENHSLVPIDVTKGEF